jgi:hypothetical protein
MWNYWLLAGRGLILLGVLPAVAGVATAAKCWRWAREVSAFVEHLHHVEARVLSIDEQNGDTAARARYADTEGHVYVREFPIPAASAPAVSASGVLSLVYDARDPGNARPGDIVRVSTERFVAWGLVALGALTSAAGLLYLLRFAIRMAQLRALFAQGVVVQTSVRDHGKRKGDRRGRFTYAYRGPDGRWYEGRSPDLAADRLDEWPAGRDIQIVYKSSDPGISEADVFSILPGMSRGKTAD